MKKIIANLLNRYLKPEKAELEEPGDNLYMQNNLKYANYSIGRFTYGEPLVLGWDEGATLTIGSFCSIATDATILLGGNHRGDWVTTFPFNILFDDFRHILGHPATRGDVIIGNDVWIGMGALILSGISIGDGAIIAARSVVTKNVEPYTVVGGNPARKIKARFADETIEKLLGIKWWEWDIEKIRTGIPYLLSTDIQKFIETSKMD